MLILSRKENQSLVIGSGITVKVVAIRGDKVRLGIEAPRSVSVDRVEVRTRKERSSCTDASPTRSAGSDRSP